VLSKIQDLLGQIPLEVHKKNLPYSYVQIHMRFSAPVARPSAPCSSPKNSPPKSSLPHVLRGLIERDRKLLGLLSQTAYAAILKIFQALLERTDVRPGCVASLQTFGAYGANFNPHAHALVPDSGKSSKWTLWSAPAALACKSSITDPRVVDRTLRHRESERCQTKDPFEPRAPPSAHTRSWQ